MKDKILLSVHFVSGVLAAALILWSHQVVITSRAVEEIFPLLCIVYIISGLIAYPHSRKLMWVKLIVLAAVVLIANSGEFAGLLVLPCVLVYGILLVLVDKYSHSVSN